MSTLGSLKMIVASWLPLNLRPFYEPIPGCEARAYMGGGNGSNTLQHTQKNQHRKAEAPRHANGVHAQDTNGEVSLLGPCVNSPHNTTTRLGTMWAARLLIPHKSASSTVFYRLLLSACTMQVDASLPTPLT